MGAELEDRLDAARVGLFHLHLQLHTHAGRYVRAQWGLVESQTSNKLYGRVIFRFSARAPTDAPTGDGAMSLVPCARGDVLLHSAISVDCCVT